MLPQPEYYYVEILIEDHVNPCMVFGSVGPVDYLVMMSGEVFSALSLVDSPNLDGTVFQVSRSLQLRPDKTTT